MRCNGVWPRQAVEADLLRSMIRATLAKLLKPRDGLVMLLADAQPLLSALLPLLQAQGVAANLASDHIALVDLPLEIHVHNVKHDTAPAIPHAVSAVFDGRSTGATTNGVCVTVVGYGDDLASCARDAAKQWADGVFPVIRSWLTRAAVDAITKAQITVATKDQRFGWSVHLGPILYRVYGGPGISYTPPDIPSSSIFKAVFAAVYPVAAHRTLFWLECFACRYPDGKVDATARLGNDDWPAGRDALLRWATDWPDTEGTVLSRREFLMFEPVSSEQVSPSPSFQEVIERYAAGHKPTSWWKRLMGKTKLW